MNDPAPRQHQPLPPPVADGVQALLAAERATILERCTACGNCFEVCPMVEYAAELRGADPAGVALGVLNIVRDHPGSPEALRWTMMCTKSGVCDAHCPEQISPRMMLRLARINALGGLGQSPQVPVKEDPDYFAKVHAFAQLSLTAEERAAWTVAPRPPRPKVAGGTTGE